MKKTLSLILSLTLIAAFAAFPVEAKILNQCHYCGGDGIYTCDAVDCKDGKLPCGRCNGTGQTKEKCAECDGTGKCRFLDGNLCSIYNDRPLICRVDDAYEAYFKDVMSKDEYYQENYRTCVYLKNRRD